MSALTLEVLAELLSLGHTLKEIAQKHRVPTQRVAAMAKHLPLVPWHVPVRYTKHHYYRMCKAHTLFMREGEGLLRASDVEMLNGFYHLLGARYLVIDFDLAHRGSGRGDVGGFKAVRRSSADEDFIIKLRPGLGISGAEAELWRIPATRPNADLAFDRVTVGQRRGRPGSEGKPTPDYLWL